MSGKNVIWDGTRVAALLGKLSEGVVALDAGGRIHVVNEAARKLLGLDDRLPSVDELDAFESGERPFARALGGECFEDQELLRARPNGEIRRLLASGSNVRDERGELALVMVVLRDVTGVRRLAEQREEITSLISHELRTPLNAIGLLAGTIRIAIERRAPVEPCGELAERIEHNVERMAAMIEALRARLPSAD